MRTFLVRTTWVVAGMLALAACSSPTGQEPATVVTITPDRPQYTAGSVATVTVQNVTQDPVGLNLCERLVERRVLGAWTVVERFPPPDAACTSELRRLEPGESVSTQVQLSSGLSAGTYRVEFPGIVGNLDLTQGVVRTSLPFEVQRPLVAVVE